MFPGKILAGLRNLTPAGRYRLLLAVPAILLVLYLLFADKPWDLHIPEGKRLKTSNYVTIYFWIAAAVNTVLLGLLAATANWWARPLSRPATPRSPRPTPCWFWPLVFVAMGLTAWFGWPRLGLSVWHDEANRVKNTIAGEFRAQDDGSYKYRAISWKDAAFQFRLPNHVLQSVISKGANDLWLAVARPKGLQFSETAIRLPGYAAGIFSVAALAMFLRRIGFARAGILAAFLLAVHPWHIRYTAEARGYIFVLALLPLMLIFLLNAVETGRWRWWLALAAVEFAMIYAYATTVYIVLVANVCIPIALVRLASTLPDAAAQTWRWLVSGALAAMALLQMLLPCIPQFIAYVRGASGMGVMGYDWTQDFLSHLLVGVPWSYTNSQVSPYIELLPWFARHPGLGAFVIFLAIATFVLGIRRFIAYGFLTGLLVVPMLLPAVLSYLETRARGGFLHEWYLIFLLPGVIALVAVGMDDVVEGLRSKAARATAIVVLAALVVGFAAWTAPQRHFLMTQSTQPDRESVLLTRPTLDPNDPRQEKILTATFFGPPGPYDPRIIRFETAAELGELARRADAEGKALFVNLGFLTTVETEHPHKYKLLENSELFETVGYLQGYQPAYSRHVFRYRPGTAGTFDFTKIPPDPGSPFDRPGRD